MMVTGLVLTQMNGGTPKAKNSRHPKRNKKITASLHVSMGQYWAIISKMVDTVDTIDTHTSSRVNCHSY